MEYMAHIGLHLFEIIFMVVALASIGLNRKLIKNQADHNFELSEIGMDFAKAAGDRFDAIEDAMLKTFAKAKARMEKNEEIEKNSSSR